MKSQEDRSATIISASHPERWPIELLSQASWIIFSGNLDDFNQGSPRNDTEAQKSNLPEERQGGFRQYPLDKIRQNYKVKKGGTSPMTTSLAKVTTEAIPSEQLDEAPVGNNNTQSSGSQHWHRRRSLPPRTTWLDNRSKTVRTVHGPRIHKMKRGLSVPATSHYSSPIDTQPDAHQLLNVDKPPTRVGYQTLTPSDQATGRHLSTTSASVPTYEGRKTLTFRGQRLGTILWSRVRELIAERLVTIPDNVTRVLLQEVYSAAWTQWPAHFKNFENSYLWQHKVQRRPNIVDTRVKVPLRPVVPTGPGTERTREFEMVLQSHVRTMALTAMIENKINERDESNIEDQPKAGVLRFAVVPTGFETSKRDEEEENEFIRGTDWKQDVQDQGREGRSTVAAVPT